MRLRPKTYSYLIDDGTINKKNKGTKKCITKGRLKFEDYKKCLQNNKIILKLQQRFKIRTRNVFAQAVHKIALDSNDDKRLQIFDGIVSYPDGANAGKVCKIELLQNLIIKWLILIIIQIKIKRNII